MAKLFREGLRGEPLKQTEIGEIPESWSLRKIASLGNLVTGTTPATNNPEYYGSDVPFISPGDIGNYRIVRLTGKNISTAGVKVSRPLPFRTVLVVCIGSTIGKVGMTTAEISCTNQQINAIICNETVVPEFVHYLMLWNTDYIRNLSTPSPVPILSKGAFGKGTVACPTDVLEQKQIAKILCAIDDRIETAEAKCNKLGSIFSSMLSLLMTGRVRITGLINSRNLIFNKQDAGRQL
jgi:type I restriction enzyme S subunit